MTPGPWINPARLSKEVERLEKMEKNAEKLKAFEKVAEVEKENARLKEKTERQLTSLLAPLKKCRF